MANPSQPLAVQLTIAIEHAFGRDFAGTDPIIRRSTQPGFDYQANVAMSLAKQVGSSPRDVAARILEHADLSALAETVEVAGPGFINVRLLTDPIVGALADAATDERLGVPLEAHPDTVVIDYSSPNGAKEMHVGHLRSTIIGDALTRVLGFLGHKVIRQNHLGDWGTQFGLLIEHLLDEGWDDEADHAIEDLDALYLTARTRFDGDPEFADRARRRVVELQSGDERTLAVWHQLMAESVRHLQAVYDRLGVLLTPDDVRGESFYNPLLPGVAAALEASGLARIDDGALCVFAPGFKRKDGEPLPMIVRKSDGGFGYAATDLAALRFRVEDLHGSRVIYAVDARQSQHFAMLFAVGEMAGWLRDDVRAEHVAFGAVLGPGRKPFQTRSGETVKLADLLDEAETRASAVVADKAPDLPPAEQAAVARAVGIGAVKYADLANDRIKDYVFEWDRMLAMDGNTAPYLQYAHARIRSIFRRVEVAGGEGAALASFSTSAVQEPAERALALQLLALD